MIKPIYGAASIGVVRVDNLQQLETAYKRVTRELARAHIVAGALQQGEEDELDAAGDAIETTTSQVGLHICTQPYALCTQSPATYCDLFCIGSDIKKQRPQPDFFAVQLHM